MSKDLSKHVDQLNLDDDEDENNNNGSGRKLDEEGTIELSDSMIEPPETLTSGNETIPVNPEDRDEEMEDFARQFKQLYELKFIEYLKSLKQNDPLNATSLPEKKYNKNTYEEDSANSTTILFYFEKLELDDKGNVNAVVTKSFDKTEMCHFQPHLFKSYGPYFNTNLFCAMYNSGRTSEQTKEFFLDLPIDLYNLIE